MASQIDIKNWLKFESNWYDVWQQQIAAKFQLEKLWDIISGVEAKPASQAVAASSAAGALPANQNDIGTWNNKDAQALSAIWDCVKNNFFTKRQMKPGKR
ncbi:hypothetical protein R1flu_003398 [Riccia fluitans]|uniref:Uncharacterized protein n=1 Tax=Riccia fluitans TaxID=41844 RepID=A0ABD1Y907_9MARC